MAGNWRDVAELDPTDEEAHTHIIRGHLARGDGRAALNQYAHLERVLDRELGVKPGDEARGAVLGSTSSHGPRVAALLTELAGLVAREIAVLAELAAAGAGLASFGPFAGLTGACQH